MQEYTFLGKPQVFYLKEDVEKLLSSNDTKPLDELIDEYRELYYSCREDEKTALKNNMIGTLKHTRGKLFILKKLLKEFKRLA